MKPMSDALKIVTQEDVELAKKPPMRAADQALGNEMDPAKLMDLLGDIDGLKLEIHERMRRIEAVKQAKSVLQEDAERTEALNKRLAEIGKAMSVAQAGLPAGEADKEAAELVRLQARAGLADAESRHASVRVLNEGVALPWPRTEEEQNFSDDSHRETAGHVAEQNIAGSGEMRVSAEASMAFESLVKRLDETEESRLQAWAQAEEAVHEARRLLDEARGELTNASGREEQAAQAFHSAQETLIAAFQSAEARLAEAEQSREAARAQMWKQANDGVQEAKRLLNESASQFKEANGKAEQVRQEFHSTQETLKATYQSASERLAEAERSWAKTDQATIEARKLLDRSALELTEARKKEEMIAASLQTMRQEFTNAYESSSQRLKEAERFCQTGDQSARDAQLLIEQTKDELQQARKSEETAAADLLSARQELTTAYQFASVAAQRRLDAVEAYHKAIRGAAFTVVLSWIAMAWMAWFAFHTKVPIWAPAAVSLILIVVAFVVAKRGAADA